MTFNRLAYLLVTHGLVPAAAMEDPEGYNNYLTYGRVSGLVAEMEQPLTPTLSPRPTKGEGESGASP